MNKRFLVALLFCVAVLLAPSAKAESEGTDLAFKVDYFHFTDSLIKNLNSQDGVYFGLEAYKQLFCRNLYLGIAIGWAGTSGSVSGLVAGPGLLPASLSADTSIDYVPIELNAKYVIPINRSLNFAFGGGGSINYFSIGSNSGPFHVSDSDWVWGGQVFGELNYRFNNWFIGADIKYQFTEDLNLFGVDTQSGADNFRAGGHIGFSF